MIVNTVLILVSLLILAIGAEGLVRGSTAIATRLGMTPMMAGLTIVAFSTSAPELAVSFVATIKGEEGIALGNVIGSNIFNIGFILAVTAIIFPIEVHPNIIKIDSMIMVFSSILLLLIMMFLGGISRVIGFAFLIALAFYIFSTIKLAKNEMALAGNEDIQQSPTNVMTICGPWLYTIVGLMLLILGSQLLMHSAIEIAQALNVAEAIIGLTVVAMGTSMPELATSIMAAIRKQPNIAVGNIVGSNIFNILGILGVCAVAKPLNKADVSDFSLMVMVVFAIALIPLLLTEFKLKRTEGAILLLGYIAYSYLLWP